MRHLARFITTLGIAACAAAPAMRSAPLAAARAETRAPAAQSAPTDSVVEYLLASAAADFHDHGPSGPVRVRDVRLEHFTDANGGAHYMLCGQFLATQQGSAGDWTPFATVKTSRFEQWLGSQAAGFCEGPSVARDTAGDLSSSLQSRLDAIR
ncbi:MAG: hypothetical protein ACJ79K_04595 [Gemmatimonadaceae bacterium]